MSGFIIFIIIAAIFMFVKFAMDSSKDSDKLIKEGGMLVKYRKLIYNFVSPEEVFKIVDKSNKYVCVAMRNTSGSIVFHFQHTFNKINVTMEMKNIFLGEHKLTWEFPEDMPQEEMIGRMETRTRQYMDNVTAKFE